jgi:hypothetical protein
LKTFAILLRCRFFAAFVAGAAAGWGATSSARVEIDSIEALRELATQDGVQVRMKPGIYVLDTATSHHFIRFTGRDSHFDLRGVTLRIDTKLFRQFGNPGGVDGFYCVIDLVGERIVFEGLTTENVGDRPGIQSRNKIFNVCGTGVVLRDVVVTTSGSSPWGYGSLYGISGGDVRKMNGIRVGWPAVGAKLINCRVQMRAMGHGIFVQGASDTLIENCHVDGLLRPTDDILAEKSGYAFERKFRSPGHTYVEGVTLGADGEILPGEMISLSEDGIRLYDQGGGGHPTGPTTIRHCTVRQMRRGICTGLGGAADRVIDCEVTDSVAAGFNIGSGDVLERCRADAKYAEALSCPYMGSRGAKVDLEILDSRGGAANDLLATLNGQLHQVWLHTPKSEFVPAGMVIAQGTRRGYAYYQRREAVARDIQLRNDTPAKLVDEAPTAPP